MSIHHHMSITCFHMEDLSMQVQWNWCSQSQFHVMSKPVTAHHSPLSLAGMQHRLQSWRRISFGSRVGSLSSVQCHTCTGSKELGFVFGELQKQDLCAGLRIMQFEVTTKPCGNATLLEQSKNFPNEPPQPLNKKCASTARQDCQQIQIMLNKNNARKINHSRLTSRHQTSKP